MTYQNSIIRGRWIAGAAVIALLAGACGGGGSSGGGSSGGGGGGSASGGQVVEIDVASSGFAFAETTATATAGHVVIKSMNPQSTGHDIALKGNGVDEQGDVVEERRRLDDRHPRPEGRHVHVLLLGAGARGRRYEGHADRQLASAEYSYAPMSGGPMRDAPSMSRGGASAAVGQVDHERRGRRGLAVGSQQRVAHDVGDPAGRPG